MAPRDDSLYYEKRGKKLVSTVGLNYFNKREHLLLSGDEWLEGKRNDDDLAGLWRIHDRVYDLDSFIKKHPGGPEWIAMTKGTDITEAFEAHHIKGVAEQLLSRYFVKEAATPRKSPFKFDDKGFYRTLKRRIANELPYIPKYVAQQSKLLADIIVSTYLILFIVAAYYENYYIGVLAGYFLTLTVNISHNFIHQRNNFRMYYMDLSMMSSREFRISHALSHHLFPNTIHDLEISMYEPVIYLMPQTKSPVEKYVSWLYALLLFPILSFKAYIFPLILQRKIDIHTVLPWVPVFTTLLITRQDYWIVLKMFVWIITWSSFIFQLIGKTAAHHHPDIFHDGDTARPSEELDFGVHQLDAVGDRPNMRGSLILVLTNFGDHALHHLFPTLDHSVLDYLYPIFLQTCLDFGVEWKLFTSGELLKGAAQQLMREPNKTVPQPLKRRVLEGE
ncbi:cytochrome b5-related protein-like [Coccinella septempunctata]|uniref:cytochrome b5-related protein-like n=1 Tax=Coccinella septempunctata TaxID=41139 RepID=UPI001D08BF3B|nr:cytochrome b5-related protein-like [Coccinella septempunctata]